MFNINSLLLLLKLNFFLLLIRLWSVWLSCDEMMRSVGANCPYFCPFCPHGSMSAYCTIPRKVPSFKSVAIKMLQFLCACSVALNVLHMFVLCRILRANLSTSPDAAVGTPLYSGSVACPTGHLADEARPIFNNTGQPVVQLLKAAMRHKKFLTELKVRGNRGSSVGVVIRLCAARPRIWDRITGSRAHSTHCLMVTDDSFLRDKNTDVA